MPSRRLFLAAAGLVLAACGSEPRESQPPAFGKAFANLPLPPSPELVSRSGSSDALQLTIHTPMDPVGLSDYYRGALSRNGWRLVSSIKNPDGSVVLYAEQKGPPLWVRIRSSEKGGSTVELTGAVVDPSRSTSSNTGAPAQPGR
ncbi:MAG TPA: hypothetical protein VFH40_09330 [Gemmatimonadales bacterium]|jgi:hypothetical protein|nr:hypothetical protein [Gemmatimonadales bacterium]